MTRPASAIQFTRTHVPYTSIFGSWPDHDLTGVMVLYHVKLLNGVEDIVPLFVGYGNIYTTLLGLEDRIKFIALDPIYVDYIDNPPDPAALLPSLRRQYRPILPA